MTMKRRDDGFALLEALIATAIFAALLGALHGGLRMGWRAWGAASSEETALSLARSLISVQGVETPLQTGTQSGVTGAMTWRSEIAPYNAGHGNLSTQQFLNGFWVHVDVRWRERGWHANERTLSMTTLKLGRPDISERP
jgi:type II secretory pathway pseudopilin PulG